MSEKACRSCGKPTTDYYNLKWQVSKNMPKGIYCIDCYESHCRSNRLTKNRIDKEIEELTKGKYRVQ